MTGRRVSPGTEGGFTVVELAVVGMIFSIIAASLVGVLITQTNAEKRVQAAIANQEEVRLAMVEMQRDLRSSEPLEELTNTENFATQVRFRVIDFDGTATRIRWRIDRSKPVPEFIRETLDASGSPIAVTYRLRGVEAPLDKNGLPRVFRFYNQDDIEVTFNAPKEIAHCTIRVEISLIAGPNNGPQPYLVKSDAELRNRLPGGMGC